MTHYNFKSIFAWNMILYNGFMAIVIIYLWTIMQRSVNKYTKTVGFFAFLWRLALTTGTGSIFGFIVAREYYDAAIMAPMFIIMSFSFGLALFLIVLLATYKWTGRPIGNYIVTRLQKLQGLFVASVLLFVVIFHLTKLYATQHHGVEHFILQGNNVYSGLFWIGYVLLGGIIPLIISYAPAFRASIGWTVTAAILVVGGGLSQMYVIIIGGQAFPMELFPGKEVTSSFGDGVVAHYAPSLPEIALGLGGTAVAFAAIMIAIKILRFMPLSLADAQVNPHYAPSEEASN
jgi:molybdopterin-containing oxidoreductase family membrane subunit